jgi:hypothetical protein
LRRQDIGAQDDAAKRWEPPRARDKAGKINEFGACAGWYTVCTVNRRGAGPRNSAVANSPPGSSLTRLEERTAPPADLKVTVDTWPTWEGAVGSRLSMYHVQLECMENRAQNQGGRSHDPGLTRGRGGPFRASKVMTRVDARPSRVAAVRERGDITRRSASPVSGQTCSEHPGSAQRAYRAAVWCSRHNYLYLSAE